MSEGIITALIGLIGVITTAIIGAYATLAAARIQNLNSQSTTGNTRRLIFFSKIPRVAIISLGFAFIILTGWGYWMWSNGDNTLTLDDIRRDSGLLAMNHASYKFNTENNLEIVGCWNTPVWLDHKISENFKIRVKFMTFNDKHEFILGLGNGSDIYSGYSYAMLPSKTLLRKLYPEKNMDDIQQRDKPTIKPNNWYTVEVERNDGELKVYLDGNRLFLLNDPEVNEPRYMYITSQAPSCDNGTVIISELEITEVGKQ